MRRAHAGEPFNSDIREWQIGNASSGGRLLGENNPNNLGTL
jgi:hypothetical protein